MLGIEKLHQTVCARLNPGPTAGDVDSNAVAGYVLTRDSAAGMIVGLDNHVGDAFLRDAAERSHGDRTVVIKNCVLPKTFFDGQILAECTRSGTEQEDADQDSHCEVNLLFDSSLKVHGSAA